MNTISGHILTFFYFKSSIILFLIAYSEYCSCCIYFALKWDFSYILFIGLIQVGRPKLRSTGSSLNKLRERRGENNSLWGTNWDALCDLIPLVKFVKCVKHLWRGVVFSKVGGFSSEVKIKTPGQLQWYCLGVFVFLFEQI